MIFNHLAIGDLDTIGQGNGVLVSRTLAAAAFDTVVRVIEFLDVLGLVNLLGLAENDLAHQHQEALLLAIASGGIGKTLIEPISEVYTLAEHVAGGWGLRRGNL